MNGTKGTDLRQEVERLNRNTALYILGGTILLIIVIAIVANSSKGKVMSVTDVIGRLEGF